MIMLMEKTFFGLALLLVGLAAGSFVNAAVWRIKNKKDLLVDRSECTHCHTKLAWRDLVPVLSWLALKGRCRQCHKKISVQYPLVELAVAAFFVASLAFWPYGFATNVDWLQFGVWLFSGILLAILFVYDLRWLLLPDKITFPLIALGIGMSVAKSFEADSLVPFLLYDVLGSLMILSGFYFVLFIASGGRWVGLGDIKLGAGLALLLADWQLALVALFMANLIGTLVFSPALAMKKVKRTSHIPFGPFLIAGFIIAGLFGPAIIDWYMTLTYSGLSVPNQQY